MAKSVAFSSTVVIATFCVILSSSFVSADDEPAAEADKSNSVEFRLAVDAPQDGYTEAELPDGKGTIYLSPDIILSKKDIERVSQSMEKVNELLTNQSIAVTLSKDAGERFKKFTAAHLNARVAVIVRGKVVFAPTIRSAISDSMVITGGFTDEEAADIIEAMTK